MGLMNTIRKNPSILIVSIGLAMAGFILMDMINSGGPGNSNQFTLGEVDGERIDWQVFSETEGRMYGNSSDENFYERKEQLWNFFVDRILIERLARDLGLGIGEAEMEDLQFGNNLSPVIQRNFANPTTGMLDRNQLNNIKQAIESDQLPADLKVFWEEQEREISKERLQGKIGTMVSKAMYVPSWQAELIHQQRNQRCEAAYVRIPFDAIGDDQVKVTDKDLEAYLQENAKRFTLDEETRAVRFVSFEVAPSSADSAALIQGLEELRAPFRDAENDTLFVENNYGSMDDAYVTKEVFTTESVDSLFAAPVGSVFGPFIESNQFMMAKIRGKMVVPDSVKARHILIQAKDPASIAQAQATLDSLKGVLEAGKVSFDTLAFQYGQDATRTSGGDLGYAAAGSMVKPFNDLIFYRAQEGKLYTVTTDFGVHLVEVTGRKFIENKTGIQIALLREPIAPSEETQKRAYQQALELVSKHRTLEELENASKNAKDWVLESSPLFRKNDYRLGLLGQGSAAREIIQWAFQQDETGGVSPDVYSFEEPQLNYVNRYMVVALDRINPAGLPKLENIRTELESIVRAQAKGKKIAERIGSQTDLATIAANFSAKVDTATNFNFANTFMTGLGNEPKFIAAVTSLNAGAFCKPVIGNNGVYVALVLNKPTENPPANVAQIRQQMAMGKANSVPFRFAEAMRKKADIEDNRSNFF